MVIMEKESMFIYLGIRIIGANVQPRTFITFVLFIVFT